MRVGVFTPLLSHLSLEDVFSKLKTLQIDTVELGTGNYPGDPHCKLSMLDRRCRASANSSRRLADHGFTISALSCHGNPLHPDQERAPSTIRKSAARPSCWPKSWASRGDRFLRLPRRFADIPSGPTG